MHNINYMLDDTKLSVPMGLLIKTNLPSKDKTENIRFINNEINEAIFDKLFSAAKYDPCNIIAIKKSERKQTKKFKEKERRKTKKTKKTKKQKNKNL